MGVITVKTKAMEPIDLAAEMNKMFGAIANLPTKPEEPKEEKK
jgi:hypothetical protein